MVIVHTLSRKQNGAALITAMLFVALAVTAAAFMSSRQYFDIKQTSNIIAIDNAYQIAVAAEPLAMNELVKDITSSTSGDIDDFSEMETRAEGVTYPVDGGSVSGKIYDLQGRFNVNNLIKYDEDQKEFVTDKVQLEIFKRLIENINATNTTTSEPSVAIPVDLASKLADWMDENVDPSSDGNGAEDDIYSSMLPSHKTPNSLISSTSEIVLLDGIWDETNKLAIFQALEPYICALPRVKLELTGINFNIASAELIAAMVDGLSQSGADEIMSELQSNPKNKPADIVAEFKKQFPSDKAKDKEAKAAIDALEKQKIFMATTEYFLLDIKVDANDVISRLLSMVKRKDKDTIFVFARGKGAL